MGKSLAGRSEQSASFASRAPWSAVAAMHALLDGRHLVGRLAEVDRRDLIVPDDERLRVAS
jgi:hypothetical protein